MDMRWHTNPIVHNSSQRVHFNWDTLHYIYIYITITVRNASEIQILMANLGKFRNLEIRTTDERLMC